MESKKIAKRVLLAIVCMNYATAGCDMIVRDSMLQGALTGSLAAMEGIVTGFFELQFGVGAGDEHADEHEDEDEHDHEEGGNALFIHQ